MRIHRVLLLLFALVAAASCGPGTRTGNPGITLASRAYNAPVSMRNPFDFLIPSALAAGVSITSLKFCVTELKFTTAIGGLEISIPESSLGLIDLGDGTKAVTWTKLVLSELSETTQISELSVDLESDPSLCQGVTYSVQANGISVTPKLKFDFKFASPALLRSGGTVTLTLTGLIDQVKKALDAGEFDDAHVAAYFEAGSEGSAEFND